MKLLEVVRALVVDQLAYPCYLSCYLDILLVMLLVMFVWMDKARRLCRDVFIGSTT